eukprot:scaffold278467_cov45-Prasinocladus_malaysianus.AAC.1
MARGLSDSTRDLSTCSVPSSSQSASSTDGFAMSMGHSVGRGWFAKQIASRGDASLSVSSWLNVFYASMDQRSSGVGGEAACSSLAVAVSAWILSRQTLPVLPGELEDILHEGSRKWRALCSMPQIKQSFPDFHFDLETVLGSQTGSGFKVNICPSK